MCLSVPVALEPQSRKRTVTRSCIAFPSSIVSRSVFESWNAKTINCREARGGLSGGGGGWRVAGDSGGRAEFVAAGNCGRACLVSL